MSSLTGLLRGPLASGVGLFLTGCMGIGSGPEVTSSTASAEPEQIDIRRFIGPDYCPEIRIRPGTEVLREYRGAEEPANVAWQASIGDTARECLYDGQGNLTLRIGVSGRVAAGPQGGPGTVSLPLRISVVKHLEAVLSTELYPQAVAIQASNSAVFREVREVTVPSPGQERDYIIYIGFDAEGRNLLGNEPPPPPPVQTVRRPEPQPAPQAVQAQPAPPAAAPAQPVQPAPAAQSAQPAPAAQSGQPARVLEVPDTGIVLPPGWGGAHDG